MQDNDYKSSKNTRTLELYARLCEGKPVYKTEESKRYCVDERTIQRDLDDIRAFLSDRAELGDNREIVYDRKQKAFVLQGERASAMSNSEILAVSKILLESRAFSHREMNDLLDKMIVGCVPQQNVKLVTDLLSNERHHYIDLKHAADQHDKLWELGTTVKESVLIELTYHRMVDAPSARKRYVEPVAIMFSEYYFYLIGYIVEVNKDLEITSQRFEYPAVFRVDRIESFRVLDKHFSIPYRKRFEDGEFRKRVQFMYPGRLMSMELRYTGKSVEAILDRIPTAKVIHQDADGYTIKAEVYGKGILMWLMSQGEYIEILTPESLRQQMKEHLMKTLELYQE